MSEKINIDQLVRITERAARLKAQWRGLYDLYREQQDEIREAERDLSTAKMVAETIRLPNTQNIDQQEARLEAKRRLAQLRHADSQAAGSASAEAGRLAAACVEYAKSHGLTLPSAQPYEIPFIGVTRPE